jgi:hypothetical protein
MPIDVFNETVVSFSDATKRLPKHNGTKTNVSTLYRWAQAGLRSHDGQVVWLETIKVGGTTCTSLEALQRFFERLSRPTPEPMPPRRTVRQRMRDIQRAEEVLDRAG